MEGEVRDEFPQAVKLQLEQRVASRCSNPDCLAATREPHSDGKTSTNGGQAAHITAASPRGARYDETMTSEQRASIVNGIWLCNFCARKIDVDRDRYPIARLREWKQKSEQAARERFGIPTEASVPASLLASTVATVSATWRSKNKRTSELSRDQALKDLRGVGLIIPTGVVPDKLVESGTFSLHYRGGLEVSEMMLFDLPGGVIDNRISVIRKRDNSFRIQVLDELGDLYEAACPPVAREKAILIVVAWRRNEVRFWVDEHYESMRLKSSITHLGPDFLLGIDIDGELSSDNIRHDYICGNAKGLNLEKDGVWRGTLVSSPKIDTILYEEDEIRQLSIKVRADYEGKQKSPYETLARFIEVVEVVSNAEAPLLEVGRALRNLLVTGYPFLDEVVSAVHEISATKVRVSFVVARSPLSKFDETATFSSIQDGIDPEELTWWEKASLSCTSFNHEKILKMGNQWFTIKDLLTFIGFLFESVPRGLSMSDTHREMLQLNNTFFLGGLPALERQVIGLRSVFLRGIADLLTLSKSLLASSGAL